MNKKQMSKKQVNGKTLLLKWEKRTVIISISFVLVFRLTITVDRCRGGQVWSRWTGVVRSCSQVQVVGVVMEHQQTVEVLSSSQDSMFSIPPRHRTINKTMNCQRHPGQPRVLKVTPAGKVRTRFRFKQSRWYSRQCGHYGVVCRHTVVVLEILLILYLRLLLVS